MKNTYLETQKTIFSLQQEMSKKQEELLIAIEEKSLSKLKKISPYFKGVDIYEMIADKLNVMDIKQEDIEFISYLNDENNFSLKNHDRKWIQGNLMEAAIKDAELFNLINKKHPKEMMNFLDQKMDSNGLVFAAIEVFDYYMKGNQKTLSTKELRLYIEEDRPDLIQRVLSMPENQRFFGVEKSKVLVGLATGTKSWRALETLVDTFDVERKATLIFNTDKKAENFFRNLKKDFDYNFFNNYEFDMQSLMHSIYNMRYLKNKENCKPFIDILVKKYINNSDLVDEIGRKINISTDEELKSIANSQFKLSYLNYKLKNDNIQTQKKYRI